ncbi:MAG: secondary thiamine-phosphate synthase enzyme YjbQ [Candidatus Oxydemutatoraceae bacterium WSBS_2016_MAG_OTU14]
MHSTHHAIELATDGRGLYDITAMLQKNIDSKCDGLCHLFIHHTSASLLITENASSAVHDDLERFFSSLVVDGSPMFQHRDEGEDDMPAHIRSVLTQVHLSIPIKQGHLGLGVWQGVYIYEHRFAPHSRKVTQTTQLF